MKRDDKIIQSQKQKFYQQLINKLIKLVHLDEKIVLQATRDIYKYNQGKTLLLPNDMEKYCQKCFYQYHINDLITNVIQLIQTGRKKELLTYTFAQPLLSNLNSNAPYMHNVLYFNAVNDLANQAHLKNSKKIHKFLFEQCNKFDDSSQY